MQSTDNHEMNLEEHYRTVLQGYYHRLQLERDIRCEIPTAHIGLEEVKLRLFLSLLDKPSRTELSGSPL